MCGHSRGACALRKRSLTRDSVATAATRNTSTVLTWLGVAALAAVVASAPAVAKKNKTQQSTDEQIADINTKDPMILVVSLGSQKVDIYRGTTLITTSSVSTGMPGHATKAGVFSILEKQRFHHSNIYSGAPMPWMNRITWSGTALHAGVVPGLCRPRPATSPHLAAGCRHTTGRTGRAHSSCQAQRRAVGRWSRVPCR